MPSFTHGKEASVLTNGYDMSAYLSSVTVAGEAEVAEVTTLGADDKAYIPGLRDATLSTEGFYAGGTGDIDEVLEARLGTQTVWTVVMQADAVGALAYGARVIDTSYEVGAELGGAVAVTIEGQMSGGREAARVLHALGSETATGTSASVDNSASTANGLSAYLHVTAASGTTPTLDVKVQHSADDATWADLATFAQVTSANGYERIAVTGTVNRYIRAQFTLGGTSPDFTFHLAAARL